MAFSAPALSVETPRLIPWSPAKRLDCCTPARPATGARNPDGPYTKRCPNATGLRACRPGVSHDPWQGRATTRRRSGRQPPTLARLATEAGRYAPALRRRPDRNSSVPKYTICQPPTVSRRRKPFDAPPHDTIGTDCADRAGCNSTIRIAIAARGTATTSSDRVGQRNNKWRLNTSGYDKLLVDPDRFALWPADRRGPP